ncbi:FAD-dependent oxidoreductase [Arcticibacter tournemirensis]|uniref:FAD-dependent oxidoreductase n=2 Tax=Arcticibacter tournemirensis TaxID=699437 RepID=A0A4Q0M560_9SPHI|nr:FAD-dependent oxidoreductase [Arcticibacter tournemirensis]
MLYGFAPADPVEVKILIIGGSASGTASGIQAARMGVKTLIVEETNWLGGMLTSAGVSAVDGNYRLPAGIWGEFRDSLSNYYGHLDSLKTGWVSNVLFEPSVGNRIFQRICSKEKNLSIWYGTRVISAEKEKGKWNVLLEVNGEKRKITASILVDATELGDIAKLCGAAYDIGMESRNSTGESVAPLEENDIIQDLTYVAILKDYGKDVSIPRPEGYDSTLFACACQSHLCSSSKKQVKLWDKGEMIAYGKLPNQKYMINWPIEGNDYYLNLIEMNPVERNEALKKARNFTMCFLYYLQKELGFKTLGLADDEYPTKDRLPLIPYHRESRRIHGKVRFSLNYITNPYNQTYNLYRTTIAVGDYPVDHHHSRYSGSERLPDLHFYPVPSYGLPLGTLIPKEVKGLIVAEKSISVSNVVNGTTRLQPVVLQIGQAAGALAALAVRNKCDAEDVSVRAVQKEILAAGGFLMPYLDVPREHILFPVYQRIGATGILRGTGKNAGWANETWFNADSALKTSDLKGLKEVFPTAQIDSAGNIPVTLKDAITLIVDIAYKEHIKLPGDIYARAREVYVKFGLGEFNIHTPIKRGAFAVLIDQILNPFAKPVDLYGSFKQDLNGIENEKPKKFY